MRRRRPAGAYLDGRTVGSVLIGLSQMVRSGTYGARVVECPAAGLAAAVELCWSNIIKRVCRRIV